MKKFQQLVIVPVLALLFIHCGGSEKEIAWVEAPNMSGLATPSELSTTCLDLGKIQISWPAVETTATEFQIEREVDGTGFEFLETLGTDVTEYTDSDVKLGRSYSYRIRAVLIDEKASINYISEYITSSEVVAEDGQCTLAAPDSIELECFNVTVSTGSGVTLEDRVRLTWDSSNTRATEFQIIRGYDPGFSETIATVSQETTQYDDLIDTEMTYFYQIVGIADDGEETSAKTYITVDSSCKNIFEVR